MAQREGDINLSANFGVGISEPLDAKIQSVATFSDLATTEFVYKGLQKLVEDEGVNGTTYVLGTDLVTWSEVGGSLTDGQGTTANGNAVDIGGIFTGQREIKSEFNGESFTIKGEADFGGGNLLDSSLFVNATSAKLAHSFPPTGQSASVGVNGAIAEMAVSNSNVGSSALVNALNGTINISGNNDGSITDRLTVNGGQGVSVSSESGLGLNYEDQLSDEANVAAWGSVESANHVPSEARIIANVSGGDIDGGSPSNVYLISQVIDGGNP